MSGVGDSSAGDVYNDWVERNMARLGAVLASCDFLSEEDRADILIGVELLKVSRDTLDRDLERQMTLEVHIAACQFTAGWLASQAEIELDKRRSELAERYGSDPVSGKSVSEHRLRILIEGDPLYAALHLDCKQKQLLDRLLKHFTFSLNKRVDVQKMIAERERIRA